MSIQQWEDRSQVALSNVQDVAVHRLGEWAQSADAAYQVAERLASSAFVPAQFKNKPVELTAAILSGLEVGLSPMAAMRAFDVIQGQAAARAITLRAIVQSHGHEMVLVESTSARCRLKGKRRGSDEWQTVTWDMTRAQGLGLTQKDNWKKQPGAMLLARATSELARLIASDAILGIGYSAEEVADGGAEQVDTVTPAPSTGTRKMSRAVPQNSTSDEAPAVPADAVESPPASDVEPHPEADGSPLLKNTTKFGKHFYARMGERDFDSDQARIEYVVESIGRFVTSTKEITEDEARMVLDRLDEEAGTVDAEVVA